MMWGEATKWAKSKGYKISRKDGLFCWSKVDTNEGGQENSLDEVVTRIFNEMTEYKWLDHQNKHKTVI